MTGRSGLRYFACALLLGAQAPAQNVKTVRDGVYTTAQAMRGESVYGMNCAKCHEGADVDGPPLTGDPFVDRWREDRLTTLFTFIRTKMPQDSPGKLSESAYLDVLAYLLQANSNPAGATELAASSLDNTLLTGRDGPKPLPTNALVRLVGCLTPGEGTTWSLTRSTDPERTRDAEQTTPEELKAAGTKSPGTLTFRLQNLAELRDGFNPDTFKGQRVQIKGVLIRQTNNDRVNVTSLESVASSCGQ
jgi:mono/diheme cytochrome c family protein